MKDLCIELEDRPAALAEVGEALARAGISIEGGGAWLCGDRAIAHYLVNDGTAARAALEQAGIRRLKESSVLIQSLDQDEPGQLGKICRKFADAGINIHVQYSDHAGQLILVVDDMVRGRKISDAWKDEHNKRTGAFMNKHEYNVSLEWTGNSGEGTKSYRSYGRDYRITSNGKPVIEGSSDPAFRGDKSRYNPEDLLVASLSSCHMLSYLHLCATNGITVLEYQDSASGTLELNRDGSGQMVRVDLRPKVTIAPQCDPARAAALHEDAHRLCFIARSVNFPVEAVPTIFQAEEKPQPGTPEAVKSA